MKVSQHGVFRRDVRRMTRRKKDLRKLEDVVEMLASGTTLPQRCSDHALTGNWRGWRDCHIEPDWLMIYKLTEEELILARTGSHSDLF